MESRTYEFKPAGEGKAPEHPFWDLRVVTETLWKWRRFLAVSTGCVTTAALIVVFLLPNWYRATTTLLPPREEDIGFNVSTMLRGLSIPGVRIPTQASPGEIFVAVLKSRTVCTQVVNEFGLEKTYHVKKMEDAIKELGHHFSADIGDDGLITLKVEDRDRDRAAAMANRMVALLDDFNRKTRSSRGKRARVFIEDRLHDTEKELAQAEDSLRGFQQQKKSLLLPTEQSGASDLAARLLAERIDLQMRLGEASSYASESSPEVQRLKVRQSELDRQIQNLPGLGLGAARLYRDVKVQEQVFSLLMAQLEEAKIEEAKDVATVEVLDAASPPERKARPKRTVIILLSFVASLILSTGYVLGAEYVRRSS
jgi:uncharacterized protein involved in exopolysaccharide biosynthesis